MQYQISKYLLGVKILRAVFLFLEQFAGPVTKQLMVGDLELECPVVPLVVQVDIVRVNKG